MGLFLESPGNFSGKESCFVFVVFAYKIKVSTRRNRSVHLGVVASRVCEHFLCGAGVSAAMWLYCQGLVEMGEKRDVEPLDRGRC